MSPKSDVQVHPGYHLPLPGMTQRAPAGRLLAAQDSTSRPLRLPDPPVRSTFAIDFYRIFGRQGIFEDWGDLVEDRGDLSGQPRSSEPEVDFADSGEPEAGPEEYFKGK